MIRNHVNYILVRRHHKLHINDCRAYSGTRIDSNHSLVIAASKEKLSKLKHKSTNLVKATFKATPHSTQLNSAKMKFAKHTRIPMTSVQRTHKANGQN